MSRARDLVPQVGFAAWETLCMRAGFAAVLWWEFPSLHQLPPAGAPLPFPHALAQWIDLTWALDAGAFAALRVALLAAAALYVAGVALPFAALTMLGCYMVAGTLRNSLGAIGHMHQLMTLVLLGQTLATWSWLVAHRSRTAWLGRAPAALHAHATRVTLQIIAASYVLSGITKLLTTDGEWLLQTRFAPVQLEKTRWQEFHNTLVMPETPLGDLVSRLCLEHGWVCVAFFGPGLLVELGAFAMLLGRVPALVAGGAIVLMHVLIALTMALDFLQNAAIVFLFAVNAPYWLTRRHVWRGWSAWKSMTRPV
jgi:hypothetical protein